MWHTSVASIICHATWSCQGGYKKFSMKACCCCCKEKWISNLVKAAAYNYGGQSRRRKEGKCRWREQVFVWKSVYASFIEFLCTHIYICTYIWMYDSLHVIYKCKFVMPVSDKPENAFFHCSMYCYSACHTAEEKKLLSNYATSCMCMLLWINIYTYIYIYIYIS